MTARKAILGSVGAVGTLVALLASATPASAATRYVFTTFLGDAGSQEKLSVYTSSDGLTFKLLSNTGYGGPTGVLRDPSIMKHTDGKYYVAYTLQSWTTSSTSFGIASSTDLEQWTFLVEVPAGVSGAHDTWAPEWFKDTDGIHLIVNIDTLGSDSDFRSYDFHAKADDLKTWDAPVELGIGPNNIDTFVVKSGATYHAFSKNESTKYIEHATSSSFHGPWSWVGKNDWAGWGSGKEGIALFQLDDGTWRMFLDCYGGCGFLYADSTDLDEWSDTKTVPGGLSGVVRHGTVVRDEMGTGGVSAGGMPGDAGSANAGRANAGGPGRSGAGASNDGGRGGLGSGGAPAEAGGNGAGASGAGNAARGGTTSTAGTGSATGGAGTGGANAASGASGTTSGTTSTGSNAGGASAGTTSAFAPHEAPGASTDPACGCALPRRGAGAARLAVLGVALLALRRRSPTRRDGRRSLSP